MSRYVSYYRVSTKKQEVSGLGLEAQRAAIEGHIARCPGDVIGEYTETETGKSVKKRPELKKALAHARAAGATLIIAKLDRLARNVAFISALMESGQEFVACDVPTANRITIHVLAAVAEEEARLISQRTKAALAALKARGVLLGSARPGHWEGPTKDGLRVRAEQRLLGCEKGRKAARQAMEIEMAQRYEPLVPWIRELRESGMTLQGIVDQLNARGFRTRSDCAWSKCSVHRLIKHYLGPTYLGQLTSKVLNPCQIRQEHLSEVQ